MTFTPTIKREEDGGCVFSGSTIDGKKVGNKFLIFSTMARKIKVKEKLRVEEKIRKENLRRKCSKQKRMKTRRYDTACNEETCNITSNK